MDIDSRRPGVGPTPEEREQMLNDLFEKLDAIDRVRGAATQRHDAV